MGKGERQSGEYSRLYITLIGLCMASAFVCLALVVGLAVYADTYVASSAQGTWVTAKEVSIGKTIENMWTGFYASMAAMFGLAIGKKA